LQKYGSYAFMLGVIVAVLAGLLPLMGMQELGWVPLLLVILGFLVGLLNIKDKETTHFLIAALALGMGSTALSPLAGIVGMDMVFDIFRNIALFVSPAAFVVAIKAIYEIARE
jgi:hypothetical protein